MAREQKCSGFLINSQVVPLHQKWAKSILLRFSVCTFWDGTRGHNIIEDKWAGASSPQLHPTLPNLTQVSKTLFFNFLTHAIHIVILRINVSRKWPFFGHFWTLLGFSFVLSNIRSGWIVLVDRETLCFLCHSGNRQEFLTILKKKL